MNIFRQFEIKKKRFVKIFSYLNVSLEVSKIMNLRIGINFYLNSLQKFKNIFFLSFIRSFNV